MQIDKDLVAAAATPLVLAILTEGESYGYAILKRVRELSDGELQWTDGMLYPLLHRLHRLGYVTREWRTPDGGRRRRYYAITDDGRAALEEHKRQWLAVTRALGDAWGRDDLLSAAATARRRSRSIAGAARVFFEPRPAVVTTATAVALGRGALLLQPLGRV